MEGTYDGNGIIRIRMFANEGLQAVECHRAHKGSWVYFS